MNSHITCISASLPMSSLSSEMSFASQGTAMPLKIDSHILL